MALIAEQYLEYLDIMRSLNLDLAGEYLVLASTLIHINSKMLLPLQDDEEEDEHDPRDELVRQLLEYEVFKETALDLDKRGLLERDVFKRGHSVGEELDAERKPFVEVDIFELAKSFREICLP
jgi:segregation and condensation protein A